MLVVASETMKIDDFEMVFEVWGDPELRRDGDNVALAPAFHLELHQCPKCGAVCSQTGITSHVAWHAEIEGRDNHPSAQTCDMSECNERAAHCKVGEAGDRWLCDEHWEMSDEP